MTVFPNPVLRSQTLQILLDDAFAGLVVIGFYNAKGDHVYRISVRKYQALLEIKIPLHGFNRGNYLVTAENNGLSTTQKLLIQ